MKINPQNLEKFQPKPLAIRLSPKRVRIINLIRQRTIQRANKQFKADLKEFRQKSRENNNTQKQKKSKKQQKNFHKIQADPQNQVNVLQKQVKNVQCPEINIQDAHISKSLRSDKNKNKRVLFDLKKNQFIQNIKLTYQAGNRKIKKQSVIAAGQQQKMPILLQKQKQKKENYKQHDKNQKDMENIVSKITQDTESSSEILEEFELQINSKQSKLKKKHILNKNQLQEILQYNEQIILSNYIIEKSPHRDEIDEKTMINVQKYVNKNQNDVRNKLQTVPRRTRSSQRIKQKISVNTGTKEQKSQRIPNQIEFLQYKFVQKDSNQQNLKIQNNF